jgi:hypothetical protein
VIPLARIGAMLEREAMAPDLQRARAAA